MSPTHTRFEHAQDEPSIRRLSPGTDRREHETELRKELAWLAGLHHRTFHRSEAGVVGEFGDCSSPSCRRIATLIAA